MLILSCIVCSYFLIDTAAVDEGDGWVSKKPIKIHNNYYRPFFAVRFLNVLILTLLCV